MVPRHLQELFTVCLAHRIQVRTGHAPRDVCQEIVREGARAGVGGAARRADRRPVDPELLEGLSADLPGVSRLERRFAGRLISRRARASGRAGPDR